MDNQFQDLSWVVSRAKEDLSKNPNRRISSLYRDLRKNKHYSLFGDYFILWAIAKAMVLLGRKRVRKQFWNAARQSKEYNESPIKILWLDNLMREDFE